MPTIKFLFDVVEDAMEKANLKARQPDKFIELQTAWNLWNTDMLPIDPDSFIHWGSRVELADRYENRADQKNLT